MLLFPHVESVIVPAWRRDFTDYERGGSRRPGVAQLLPGRADSATWANLGVSPPDEVVKFDVATGASVVGDAGTVFAPQSSPLGGRKARGMLVSGAWDSAPACEAVGTSSYKAANATDWDSTGSWVALCILRLPRFMASNAYQNLFYKHGSNGYWEIYQLSSTEVDIATGEGLKWFFKSLLQKGVWSLVALAWDNRDRKMKCSIQGDAWGMSTAFAAANASNNGYLHLLYKVLAGAWACRWSGSNAESVIDGWASFAASFWKHGAIDLLAVSCACSVAVPSPGGAGLAFWGTGHARLSPSGLVSHPSRTNLLLRSEDFDTAPWSATGATATALSADAPSGLVGATKLKEDNNDSVHAVSQGATVAASTEYAFCVYVKPVSAGRGLQLSAAFVGGAQTAEFDLDSKTVLYGAGQIEDIGEGWLRCQILATAGAGDSGTSTFSCGLYSIDQDSGSYQGDNASYLYLYGAQVEAAKSAGPYLYTRTASASSVTPVYTDTAEKLLAKLSRRIRLVCDVVPLALEAVDIPLFGAVATHSLDCYLEYYAESGGYYVTLTDGTTTLRTVALPLIAGQSYRILVRERSSGVWQVKISNTDTLETLYDTGAVAGPQSPGTVTAVKWLSKSDGTGQQQCALARVKVW